MSSMKDYVDCIPLKVKHKIVQFKATKDAPIVHQRNLDEYINGSSSTRHTSNSFDVQCGLNRKLLRKFQIQRKIDLHGCTQEEAFTLLHSFFAKCQQDGIRYVIVITGGNAMKTSILRSNFKEWIHDKFSEFVVSYTQAKLNDGGQGAFYVVIRKR